MPKQFIILFLLCVSWGLIGAAPVDAHRVNVFAWVEGNTIYTTAKFSGGRAAKASLIEVYDSQKKLLLQGKSEDDGSFSFPTPKIDNLLIIVKAGTGHQGSWKISREELTSIPEPGTHSHINSPKQAPLTPTQTNTSNPITSTSTESVPQVDLTELERVVAKVVAEKLHPLIAMLAELRNPKPGLKEILGGLGYIIGLVGIATYFQSRKNKTHNSTS
ncbi:hypothetical protein KAI46_11480 [bacterium]|nr:hypothetical protein [bacterium]